MSASGGGGGSGGRVPPDQDQRDLIVTALDSNILVEAAAGTGKTTSMALRMVALLRAGMCVDIRTMAAVTFTRKAAAELRARFRVCLEKAARDAGGEEKKRLEAALEHIDQCCTGTIHSFCGRLLSERPIEAGIDVAFEEIDEDTDGRLREEAWKEFVARLLVSDPKGIMPGLEAIGIELRDLEGTFTTFANYPDVHEWPVPPGGSEPPGLDETVAALETYLTRIKELLPRFPEDPETDTLIPKYRNLPRIISHYEDLRNPIQLVEVLGQFDTGVKEIQRPWIKTGDLTGEDAKAERAAWDEFRETVVRPFMRSLREYRYVHVMKVMFAAREVYDEMRRERGQLNYQDLLIKAAALLRENPHVRRYMSERFTHLLVDEFQDTDPIQAEVMLLLADTDTKTPGRDWHQSVPRPGSLFVVGDPKQSIYRFRRADIVTYNRVKEKILGEDSEGRRGMLLYLAANFRTTPLIIQWVNDVFEPQAGAPADSNTCRFPAESSEESPAYVPLENGRDDAFDGELSGVLRLDIPRDNQPGDKAYSQMDDAVEYEADRIARTIRFACDSGLTAPRSTEQVAAGVPARLDYADFMIITRMTKRLDVYARKLQEYGIPHQVTGGSALSKVGELRLLYYCLRALVRPDDPVALVGALRSELFGVSDAALFRFKKAGGFFSCYAEVPGSLPEYDAEAFRDAFDRMKRYSRLLSKLPPVAALEKIAGDLGLLVLASSKPGGDVEAGGVAKAIEILRAARDSVWTTIQLVDLLGEFAQNEQKSDALSVCSSEKPLVRVMNLHKVKGLEAPIVFLAEPAGGRPHSARLHVDRSERDIKGYMLFGRSDTHGHFYPVAQPVGWDALAEKEERFQKSEQLRLLYVAATRAGSATVITQRSSSKAANPWSCFEPCISPDRELEDPGPQSAPTTEARPLSVEEVSEAEAEIESRVSALREPTYYARGAREYALSQGTGRGVRVESRVDFFEAATPPGEGEHGVEWGSVIHALLDVSARNPEADLVRLAEAILPEYGLDAGLVPAAAGTVQSVTRSEIWRRAQESDCRLTEVPFHIEVEDESATPTLLRGVIDMVFKEEDGWVLVDYKTDRLKGTSVEDLAERYAPQLQVYRDAWQKCTGEKVSETAIYFIDNSSYFPVG
ncbi:MAG: UvrD-helicase domain-containing protein [Actinobacteria bacterium]|nr:UvrD-helicase domain-containing protein [Actinomycetota bacterium]